MYFGCEDVDLSLGGRRLLSGVSCSVEPRQIVGLVGPNGAGKTSLFEVMCGRYEPDHGAVILDGHNINSAPFHMRARLGLARTYQSPIAPTRLSVGETFHAARKSHRPFLNRHDAEWAARVVQLRASWETPAAALGTFDRRKLLLACLVLRRPRVLLLDEPASGLISAEIDELDLILRRLVDEYRMGVILIEHRLELLSAVADACVALDLGKVIATGPPDHVFEDPRVKAADFNRLDA